MGERGRVRVYVTAHGGRNTHTKYPQNLDKSTAIRSYQSKPAAGDREIYISYNNIANISSAMRTAYEINVDLEKCQQRMN